MLSGARDARDAVHIAQRAEQAGIAEVWVSEDYFERGAFVIAAAVASATSSVQVGLGVVNPWTRHPMVTAMEFAGLDEIAGGRGVLGIGASNQLWIQQQCGIPFRAPLSAMRESVSIIRSALAGEHVTTSGEHFSVDAELSFTPLRPRPPIHLGAKGKRSLRLARDVADGVLLSILSAPSYVRWAREQCGTSMTMAAYVLTACGKDAMQARESIRPRLAHFLGVHGSHDITRTAGMSSATAQRFRDAWSAGSPAVELADPDVIDTFAVAGDLDDCAQGLDRLADAGLDTAVLCDLGDERIEGLLDLAAQYPSAAAAR